MASNETSKYKLTVVEGTELKLFLNGAQGPAGAVGPAGPTGGVGPAGPQGPSGLSSSTFPYVAKTTSTSGDPLSTFITWDQADQITASTIRVSHIGSDTNDYDVLLSIIKGNDYVIIQSKTNSNKYQKFSVTGAPTIVPNSYIEIPVSNDSFGTSPTNFSNGDPILLIIQSVGLTGDPALLLAGGTMDADATITLVTTPDGNGSYLESTIGGDGFSTLQYIGSQSLDHYASITPYDIAIGRNTDANNISLSTSGGSTLIITSDNGASTQTTSFSGYGVVFDNNSKLSKGTTNAGLGGNSGIALKCSVDYELKWEAGRLYTMDQYGFTIRRVDHCGTTVPTATDDSTKGFIIGSIWTLDNGTSYECTSDSIDSAVWVAHLLPNDALPLAGGAMDTGAVITLDIAPDGNGFSTDSEVGGWGFGVQQKENGVNTNVLSYVDIYGFHADDSTTSTSTDLSSIGLTFDNGSSVRKGTTDAGLGGNKGVALRCSLDYELKWDAGRLYKMEQDGFTIRRVDHCRNIAPTAADDSSKGFVVGSLWVLDDGNTYICSNATTDAAVWNLSSIEPSLNVKLSYYTPYAIEVSYYGSVYELYYYGTNNNNYPEYRSEDGQTTCISSAPSSWFLNFSGDGGQWAGDGASPELVLSWTFAYQSTPPASPPVVTTIPSTFDVNDVVTYGGRVWYCFNSYTVIPPNQEPSIVQEPYEGSPYWKLLASSFILGDGLVYSGLTNTISCNTNIARRAGNQTFTGNNNYGTSIAPVTTTFFGTQTFNGSRTLAGASTFSGQVELTGQALTNGTSAVTRDLGDVRYGTTYVGVNENNVSSTNNTPITLASVTLPIGRYQIESCISATAASSAGGFLFGLSSSSAIKATLVESYGSDNAVTLSNSIGSDSTTSIQRSIGTGLSYRRLLTGIIDIVTANTVVSIEFCQSTTNAIASTTRKRAYITARKIA